MQLKIHMVTIEDLMPQDHFLRTPNKTEKRSKRQQG